ncbi:hypothetical protein F4556_005552 [Kitasatospora gansuensis]|uniref:Uncharacterized protein n=1 Tax=Kitasatospora gansuensis TaxID=258050 RepID=A0A7W7SH68_9ACTN|nr:hypothetical protein [Kitasatospora gansuensis]MBB4950017.1 hypothetical protein [Kitasatospora gansuensis]
MDEQPKFRPAEQVETPLRRAVMEPQAAPLWGGGDDVIPVEHASFERVMPKQGGAEPFFSPVEQVSERVMPKQGGAEPFFSPVEQVSERVMPKQGGAEPFFTPAEQSSERLMPRQMHTMAGEDPFGTVSKAQPTVAGVPAGTVAAMQAGVPAGEGVTAALKTSGDAPVGTIPAMPMRAPAGEGVTAALKTGADPGMVSKQALSASSTSGAAGAGFVAIPEQYRAAAGPVLGVADQLKELYTGLSGYMHGMHGNSPWGNDSSGKGFANGEDGEPGYLDNALDILEALKSLPEVVERIGKNLKGMGDGYDNAEQVSHSGIRQYDPALPPPELRTVTAPSTIRPGRH